MTAIALAEQTQENFIQAFTLHQQEKLAHARALYDKKN